MKKRKDGYYKLTKVINGKQKSFYGKTREECRKKLNEFVEKKDSALFRDVAEEWWDNHQVEYNTKRGYKASYERAIEEFGSTDLTDIRTSEVSAFINELAAKGYSDKTIRTQKSVLNMIFTYAINNGFDINNPARDITIPKRLPKTKVSLPSDEDIQKVKDSVNEPFGLFAYMLMYTGLRRGEILALRYDDIFDGYIRVNKSVYYIGNEPHIKITKTEKSERRIPVLDKLSKELPEGKGYIFNHMGKPLPYHIYLKNWYSYKENTKIKCTPHQLRHCFATMLYENKVTPKDAQYLLGHAQVSTTMDIYTDIRKQREQNIRESIKNIDISTSGVENRV